MRISKTSSVSTRCFLQKPLQLNHAKSEFGHEKVLILVFQQLSVVLQRYYPSVSKSILFQGLSMSQKNVFDLQHPPSVSLATQLQLGLSLLDQCGLRNHRQIHAICRFGFLTATSAWNFFSRKSMKGHTMEGSTLFEGILSQ